ncbi:HNH endonuclease [Solibacillus sp. FSL K6-1126]|uniref:HNH endonuclease n=1 Tax=Solibacillus sp. FSL K6-1126 TaxID=2921463 RepID=UPI0030F62F2F
MSKKCSKCKEIKIREKFGIDSTKSDGLTSACRECNNNREKKRRANGGDFTKEQKQAAFEKYGHLCQICRSVSNLEVDHKLAQDVCKPNTASNDDNAWVLCKGCNIAKGTRILKEVIREIPSEVLVPMLLEEYAKPFAQSFIDEVKVSIGGKLFTEVKPKKINSI